ncbi:MAG TPA: glycosyltransferase [Jatrophihabitans sp.]|nr:glycosyltransferase [Jatrophihabitans sp.]
MRIALVSEHASPLAGIGEVDAGGQNVHVAALASGLALRGHQVVVYTRRDAAELPDRVVLDSGVQVEHVPAGPPHRLPKDELAPHMPAFADHLARRWRLARPDLVHAHFWMSGQAALAAAGGQPRRIPVLQTFHALGSVKRRWQADADTSPPHRLATERRIARTADRIIATCADEVRELRLMGADPGQVDVIPCGVDAERFRPEPGSEIGQRLLSIGRLVPRKGVADTIQALAWLPTAQLVIAGGPVRTGLAGDPEYRRLQALADELGVADRVEFVGQVPHEQLPALIRSAAVVVCAPWYEPFGIVPVEAMACGVPVVASAVGGMLDTVVDGRTGLLVPPQQPQRLAAALGELLADRELRRRYGRAARRRALHNYTWPAVAEATERSYQAVTGRGAAAQIPIGVVHE